MSKKKKPYKKPTLLSEKIIEQAALGCKKCTSGNPIVQARCSAQLSSS
ncbi:MAG TPA: hypothetical protein P5079_09975 [Elusimicrobiota bacterium]|nr:hypothetical protein [Elusimicrobiota bacterium]